MNTQLLNGMYSKLDDDDYKTLVIKQCKRTIVSNNQEYLYLSLKDKKVPDIAKIYIIDFIIDNCSIFMFYKYTILNIFSMSMRCISEKLLSYMFEKIIYKNIIDNDIPSETIILDIIYIMENNSIKLNCKILKIVHDKYGECFFNNKLCKFDLIKSYCYTFSDYLTCYEKVTFAKKLQFKKRHEYIEDALEKINFDEKQKQKLQSIVILNNF